MKKLVSVIAALIILALLVAPTLLGRGIQQTTAGALLEMVPDQADSVLEFKRGWFSSQARIQVRVAELDRLTAEPVTLLLDLDIRHGPLLFTPQGPKLGAGYAVIEPHIRGMALADVEPEGELESSVPLLYLLAGFDNTAELGIELEQLTARNPEAQLTLHGVQGNSLIFADLSSSFSLMLDSTSLNARNGQFDLSVENLALSGNESDLGQPFSPGQSSIDIVRLSSAAPLPFALNRVRADYQLAENIQQPDSRDFSQRFSIDTIEWDLPVHSLAWQLQLSGLSDGLLTTYTRLIDQSGQSGATNASQVTDTLTALGQEFLLRLGQEDFTLNSTLELDAFQGDHRLELSVAWPGLPGLVNLDAFDLRDILAMVNVRLLIDGDEAALMNSPFAQTVLDYRALLTLENGRVQALITLADSQLNINGDILPLEQFINSR